MRSGADDGFFFAQVAGMMLFSSRLMTDYLFGRYVYRSFWRLVENG
jgi:hypothetical protein